MHNILIKRVGRPAVRGPAIVRELRRRIIDGEWTPGMRLPTRSELCVELDCSTITLQQAMNALMEQGFVVSGGRNGSFVHSSPPHLSNVAVVFPKAPGTNRFWTALNNEAQRAREDGFSLTCWYGVECHMDDQNYLKLVELVTQERLAGIVFASSPHLYEDSPLLTYPGIPRVAFMSARGGQSTDLGIINFSGESFVQRAVERLHASGHRRIAVITHPSDSFKRWEKAFAEKGLELRLHWFHPIHQSATDGARQLARLLFHEGQAERPDAVIVTDDNCVEAITRGIAEAGVFAPRDVEIVAHSNFPWPPPSALPVTRLGWDAHAVLETAIQLLGEIRDGKKPSVVNVDAVFEDEVAENR